MIRSAALTFRIHRIEVLISAVLLGLLGVSALVLLLQVRAADPGFACWEGTYGPDGGAVPGCEPALRRFFEIADTASFLSDMVGWAVPIGVGLLLSVPVVGREIELRTAGLSWSLSGARSRWLRSRLLPMLVVALVGCVTVGLLLTALRHAAYPWSGYGPGPLPSLEAIGREGITLVGRGILTLGVGLLAGAVIGRTLPAIVLAGVVCFGYSALGALVLQAVVAEQVAAWREYTGDDDDYNLRYVGGGYRDGQGRIVSYEEAQTLVAEQCLRCANDGSDQQWLDDNLTRVYRVAPVESYSAFEAADLAFSTGVGVAAMLLSFPVVTRRRPA